MTIPVTSPSVNVDDLHPVLFLRVEAMLADPRMAGYRVVSGVRTYEMQKSLFSGWRKRLARVPGFQHYNRAANPDLAGAATFDGLAFRGSYHMIQDDGYGHAVDLRGPATHTRAKKWRLVGEVGDDYGLRQTVAGEWWHLQARDKTHWFDAPRIASSTGEDSMILLLDSDSGTWRVAVPGEGSAVIDAPNHWADVIKAGRRDGIYRSPYMSNLIDKIRAER